MKIWKRDHSHSHSCADGDRLMSPISFWSDKSKLIDSTHGRYWEVALDLGLGGGEGLYSVTWGWYSVVLCSRKLSAANWEFVLPPWWMGLTDLYRNFWFMVRWDWYGSSHTSSLKVLKRLHTVYIFIDGLYIYHPFIILFFNSEQKYYFELRQKLAISWQSQFPIADSSSASLVSHFSILFSTCTNCWTFLIFLCFWCGYVTGVFLLYLIRVY